MNRVKLDPLEVEFHELPRSWKRQQKNIRTLQQFHLTAVVKFSGN